MIRGVGHDLVEIVRIMDILGRRAGAKFLSRVLTPAELDFACSAFGRDMNRRWAEFAAGRFAAKEAAAKALGCGIGAAAGFQDLCILPDEAGRPLCRLSDGAAARLGLDPEHTVIHVSITHTRELASAVAIVETAQAYGRM